MNDLSIAVCAGVSFIKAIGEYFAVKIPLCTQLELMAKHIPISVSSAAVSLVVGSYLCGIYGVGSPTLNTSNVLHKTHITRINSLGLLEVDESI